MLNSSRKYDPSENRQYFNDILLKVHCCRYWQLSEWECNDMAFPFWRLYHNTIEGARISFNGNIIRLTEDKIVIIPPNTSYSNALKTSPKSGVIHEGIAGKKIVTDNSLEEMRNEKMVDHLFIHFNLGIPYDFVNPGIYTLPITPDLQARLWEVKKACIYNTITNISMVMELYSIITRLIACLPLNTWSNTHIDNRIFRIISHVESNLNSRLDNEGLAQIASMATNSFARLFKQNMGETVQQYIIKRKVEKAQLLLHHSDNNIDEIAFECGFCDRHHFSKAFKQYISMTPATYRKMHTYGKKLVE